MRSAEETFINAVLTMSSPSTDPQSLNQLKGLLAVAGGRAATEEACEAAASRAAMALLDLQRPDGHWRGDLLADTTLESDYVLLQLWLDPPADGVWRPQQRVRIDKACRSILSRQLPDGGFWIYPEGPSDVSASVKAYTALKLGGTAPESEAMRRLRNRILALGGIQSANSYVKMNLSLFGLYPRAYVPTVPPELVLIPGNVLYEMSSWTRAIVVPLSIVQAVGRTRPAPAGFNLNELTAEGKSFALPQRDGTAVLFHQIDRAVKMWQRFGIRQLRQPAIRAAEKWMLDRTRHSEGLGAVYPSMMYLIMALDALGYPKDHPDLAKALDQFNALLTETDDGLYFQPCFSPVWDTAYATFALGEMGDAPADRLQKAADWLIEREVRYRGDWSIKRPDLAPGGWAFEYENDHYPDIDDTAMVLLALMHANGSDPAQQAQCEGRAFNWLANMQSTDGGWAAFDVDNDWAILNKVPFADHNAMLDPTCPDITGRVLEALCRRNYGPAKDAARRGVQYLFQTQQRDGRWWGRWGVNYVYGTFLALRGMRASGDSRAANSMSKAAQWMVSVQNSDGGWGETCEGYLTGRFSPGTSTPSQTAWGILALLASGDRGSVALQRGAQYLIDTQREDGEWDEPLATGTGFPNVFYLRYTLYRNYFPLLALRETQLALAE